MKMSNNISPQEYSVEIFHEEHLAPEELEYEYITIIGKACDLENRAYIEDLINTTDSLTIE